MFWPFLAISCHTGGPFRTSHLTLLAGKSPQSKGTIRNIFIINMLCLVAGPGVGTPLRNRACFYAEVTSDHYHVIFALVGIQTCPGVKSSTA